MIGCLLVSFQPGSSTLKRFIDVSNHLFISGFILLD